MDLKLNQLQEMDDAQLQEAFQNSGMLSIVEKRELSGNDQANILGKIDMGEGFVKKEQQPNDLIELKPEDQFLLKDKATMFINLTTKIGCVLPNIHYCPAAYLANITKGKKLVAHKEGVAGFWIKWKRHKESMKFKESSIQVWINNLDQFSPNWKLYLPERIRKNYEENVGKEVDDMELKDFDTKWFIGILRSLDQQVYTSIVAAQKLIRLQNQKKTVSQIKPEISNIVLQMIKREQSTLKAIGFKTKVKKRISGLQGISRSEKKKISIVKNIQSIRKMLNELPQEQQIRLGSRRRNQGTDVLVKNPVQKKKQRKPERMEEEKQDNYARKETQKKFMNPILQDTLKKQVGKASRSKNTLKQAQNISHPVTRFQTKLFNESKLNMTNINSAKQSKFEDRMEIDDDDELKQYMTRSSEDEEF